MNADKKGEIICVANGEPITYAMLSKALQEIGLRQGDTFFVHSDLLALSELIVEVVGMEGTI